MQTLILCGNTKTTRDTKTIEHAIRNAATTLRSWLLTISVAVLATAFARPLHAQTATLTGKINDKSGAATANVSITLRNVNTNVSVASRSNANGEYTFSALSAGTYNVRVEEPGFEVLQRNGIALTVDTTSRLDLTLAIGKRTETVEVSADLNQLQPNNAEIATAISSKQYDGLPLIQSNRMRNPSSFVYLAPGVQGNIRLDGNEYTGATNVV
jgi:hypothetical protein